MRVSLWDTDRSWHVLSYEKVLKIQQAEEGSRVWGRKDPRVCTAKYLHCYPETITTLLTGYTPTQTWSFFMLERQLGAELNDKFICMRLLLQNWDMWLLQLLYRSQHRDTEWLNG